MPCTVFFNNFEASCHNFHVWEITQLLSFQSLKAWQNMWYMNSPSMLELTRRQLNVWISLLHKCICWLLIYLWIANNCRSGSLSRTPIPTIRMTESGLASISSFYPISSADAESGLNSTRDVLELDSDNTETLRPTTWEIVWRLVNDIESERTILNCSSTLPQQVTSFLIKDGPWASGETPSMLMNGDVM